jgi:hypothetical protein
VSGESQLGLYPVFGAHHAYQQNQCDWHHSTIGHFGLQKGRLAGGAWEVSSGIELGNLSSLEKQLRTD